MSIIFTDQMPTYLVLKKYILWRHKNFLQSTIQCTNA